MTTTPTRRRLRRWYLAFPLVLVGILILSACGGNNATSTPATSGAAMTATVGMGAMPGMASTPGASGSAASASMPFDEQFIDMMVPHHMGAVAMAQIAVNRAEHPELKQLAQGIIASQNTEITQMKQWRMSWFGSDQTPPMDQMGMLPGMDMNMMNGMTMSHDIQSLQTATPFDKAFLMAMIPHHQSAIAGAKLEQEKGQHPELKQLAGSIITDQQKEIDQMQNWLKTWYP